MRPDKPDPTLIRRGFAVPVLLLFLIFHGLDLEAQEEGIFLDIGNFNESELDSLDVAERLVEWGENPYGDFTAFRRAIPIYESLLERHPEDDYLLFRAGVCHLETDGHFERAIELLSRVQGEHPEVPEVNVALAEAYHQGYRFDKALEHLKKVEEMARDLSPGLEEKIPRLKRSLKHAKELNESPRDVSIRNIGETINSEASEYVPVISSDESILIFTYRGENSVGGRKNWDGESDPYGVYHEDIHMAEKGPEGDWLPPEPIEKLNSEEHDANIALSPDGQRLFIYHYSPESSGDIYVSRRKGDEWSEAEKLKGEVNQPDSWEGSVSVSSDGQTIYFSSTRDGGYGGRDLYTAELLEDSTWGNVQNLGERINTEEDDDAPFIHPENTALFFSSKGHNSMGGYDIFRTDLEKGEWSEPVNLGAPVNTPSDDIYYVISADGKRGYYSSGKPEGYGRQDIYVVEPGYIHDDPTLVLYKGNVNFCDEPIDANIRVLQEHDGEELAYYTSNSASGKFLLNLPSGKSYDIKFSLEDKGLDTITKNVNAIQIDSFMEIEDEIHFYTDECRPDSLKEIALEEEEKGSAEKSEEGSEGEEEEGKTVLKIEKRKIGDVDTGTTVDMEYEEILEEYGEMSAEGLVFKVQVAAYRHPENYEYDHLKDLGDVKSESYPDGITRFVMDKEFETIREADEFLQKVIDAGQLDAFVIAFLDGQRTYLEELVPAVQM